MKLPKPKSLQAVNNSLKRTPRNIEYMFFGFDSKTNQVGISFKGNEARIAIASFAQVQRLPDDVKNAYKNFIMASATALMDSDPEIKSKFLNNLKDEKNESQLKATGNSPEESKVSDSK